MQEKVPAASRRRGASGRAVKMEAWFLRKHAQASRAACQPIGSSRHVLAKLKCSPLLSPLETEISSPFRFDTYFSGQDGG
jgi:hypothetical protein